MAIGKTFKKHINIMGHTHTNTTIHNIFFFLYDKYIDLKKPRKKNAGQIQKKIYHKKTRFEQKTTYCIRA